MGSSTQLCLLGVVCFFIASTVGTGHPAPHLTGRIFDMAATVDKTCREKSGAADGSFTDFMTFNKEVDQKYKCYIECVMKQFSELSHGGEFNLEDELLNVPTEIRAESHKVIHTCKHITLPDPCETAYQIHKCYYENNTQLYTRILAVWTAKTKKKSPPA